MKLFSIYAIYEKKLYYQLPLEKIFLFYYFFSLNNFYQIFLNLEDEILTFLNFINFKLLLFSLLKAIDFKDFDL